MAAVRERPGSDENAPATSLARPSSWAAITWTRPMKAPGPPPTRPMRSLRFVGGFGLTSSHDSDVWLCNSAQCKRLRAFATLVDGERWRVSKLVHVALDYIPHALKHSSAGIDSRQADEPPMKLILQPFIAVPVRRINGGKGKLAVGDRRASRS